jgi:hypothetical protein
MILIILLGFDFLWWAAAGASSHNVPSSTFLAIEITGAILFILIILLGIVKKKIK